MPKDLVTIERRIELLAALDTVRTLLDVLHKSIAYTDVGLPAMATLIPVRAATAAPTEIVPVEVAPDQARALLARAVGRLTYEDDQLAIATYRCAGVLCCSPQTLALITSINEAKTRFKDLAKTLSHYQWTTLRRSSSFARVQRLQVYRLLHATPEPPLRISFFWQAHSTAWRPMTVAQARVLIRNRRAGGDAHSEALLAAELLPLASLEPLEVIVQRKPVAPHPEAIAWYPGVVEGESKEVPGQCLSAALPLFIPGRELPTVKSLPDFDARDEKRAHSKGRHVEALPLMPALHLYRFLEGYRVMAPTKGGNGAGQDAVDHVDEVQVPA